MKSNALYSDSTLALDPKTGAMKWYHQYLQDDTWDLDYAYERLLIDLPFDGQPRKQVVTVGKLGIIESLDRTTGEWLWAKQTIPQNVVAKIDEKTGAEDDQRGGDPAYRQDDRELPRRPGRSRLAGDRLQPEDADALSAAERVLLEHDAHSRSMPGRPIRAAGARSSRAPSFRAATATSAASTR